MEKYRESLPNVPLGIRNFFCVKCWCTLVLHFQSHVSNGSGLLLYFDKTQNVMEILNLFMLSGELANLHLHLAFCQSQANLPMSGLPVITVFLEFIKL